MSYPPRNGPATTKLENLLLAITTALFLARVTISGAEVLTVGGRAHDEFDVRKWDGSHVERERKANIVVSVAAVIAALG